MVETKKILFINPSKCIGCRRCEIACSIAKEGEINPSLSRISVVSTFYINMAVVCRFCEKHPCVSACPQRALRQENKTGIILVDELRCIGCDWCIQACPFGVITFNQKRKAVVICDLCGGDPMCVKHCPTEAIELVSLESLTYQQRKNAVINQLSEII